MEIINFLTENQEYLPPFCSDKVFLGTVVNPECPSVNGGSRETTSAVSFIFTKCQSHRLIKITDWTLDDTWQKPRGVSSSWRRITRQIEHVLRQLRETTLGFLLRVIVNEFHTKVEKTTSSVLSVIFIKLWQCYSSFLNAKVNK